MATTAGERRSLAVIAGLGLLTALQSELGCAPIAPADSEVAAVGALLVDVGPEVVIPAIDAFVDTAADLEDAARAWEQATVASGAAEVERTAAAAAFDAAMSRWQVLEVMQVGPAAPALTALGGADLRDEVYSWPTVSPCRVDQETVLLTFTEAAWFDESLVNSYGLDALEHLLHTGPDNACPNQVDINADGSWDALGVEGVALARARFSVVLAGHVRATADELSEAWSPTGGGFADALAMPGTAGSPYETQAEALNAVFDAMFYVELVTKDRKLALPLGLGECTADCGDMVEGLESEGSSKWVAANLEGLQLMFTGGSGIGFDDLLRDQGHGDLAERIETHLVEARSQAEALTRPLDAVIADDPQAAAALYDAVRAVTDDLKGDLATVLALQLPTEAAGDND